MWPLFCLYLIWSPCCILHSLLEDSLTALAPHSLTFLWETSQCSCLQGAILSLTHPLYASVPCRLSLCRSSLSSMYPFMAYVSTTCEFLIVIAPLSISAELRPPGQLTCPLGAPSAWAKLISSFCHPNLLLLLLRNLGVIFWPCLTTLSHAVQIVLDCSSQVPLGLVSFLAFLLTVAQMYLWCLLPL